MTIASVPISALRVREGKVAVTLDIWDLGPMSIVVNADAVENIVEQIDREVGAELGSRRDERTHVAMRRPLDSTMRASNEADKKAVLPSALWLALNHPHYSDEVRRGMSDALRTKGRTHLTITVSQQRTWAFALGDGFFDLTEVLAQTPPNQPFSIGLIRRSDTSPLN